MTLKDQRVVIIGGSSGIGLATAGAAAAEGAAVIIAASDEGRYRAALTTLPRACESVVVDLRSQSEERAL